MNEQETLFGSRPSPNKGAAITKKATGVPRVNGNGASLNRRLSLGNSIMQPATPDIPRTNGVNGTRTGASVGKNIKNERSRPAAPVNYVAISKDDTASLHSGGGSDPTSPKSG